jgi:prepilin-type N-terminal cleavage/methylation domain-containing protein
MLGKMHRPISNEKAFTLIEVIVCLVLIGIVAAIAGMGLIKIAEGYVFAKLNAETSQKAQVAMARIVKELGAAEKEPAETASITAADVNTVTFKRRKSFGSTEFITNTIDLFGKTVRVQVDTASNAVATTLINDITDNVTENIKGFNLDYYKAEGGAKLAVPVSESERAQIRRIDIKLTLKGANNTPIPFDKISVFMQESY